MYYSTVKSTIMKLIWGLVLLLYGVASAQTPIRIDQGDHDPNETSICIDRTDIGKMIAGSNLDQIYRSQDTGKTWTKYHAQSEFGVYGDPVFMSNRSGKIFFAHLSRNSAKIYPDWFDKIVVQYSTDGGETFSSGAAVGYHPTKMQDKPWLNLDEWVSSPYQNRVYVSWTEFDQYKSANPQHKSNIKISWSDDGGNVFSPAVVVSDISGGCLDDDNSTEGATTASLPDGTLCITWSAFGKIWFDKSKDGGKTWGKDKLIAEQVGGWDMDIPEIYRANGFPFILCDKSEGPHRGRLYVFFGDKRLGDADEWLIWSDDEGKTWSKPMRINTDVPSNGRDQFLGHFAIDQTNGNWYAVFYDQRYGIGAKELDVTLAWGVDTVVYNRRLTTQSFAAPGKARFFGDYIGIDAHQQWIAPCWTANEGPLGVYTLPLNTDALKPHSSSKREISVVPGENSLTIRYTSGIEGTVLLKGKRLGVFPIKHTIMLKQPSGKSDQIILPVTRRKYRTAWVSLRQPGTTILEESVWSIRK